jgi:protoporphyrinogen oxidase
VYDYEVSKISFNKTTKKWVVNNKEEYDLIVNTLPLNQICNYIENVPDDVLNYSSTLKYNQVTTMFWETEPTERTWTYLPEDNTFFHRYIHIGNFYNPQKNFTITETVGNKTYEEMVENGKKDSFLKTPLAYNVSEHAYVVFDQNYDISVKAIKSYLSNLGIKTLGRFGEWEYYNMDICIKKAMDLFESIKSNLK